MNDISERRKFKRIKTHVPVKYRKLREGAGSVGVGSLSRDLSQGGVHFRTGEFISMACRLILEVDIPMLTRPVKAISKVAWIRKTDSGNDYEIGNQFLEISKKDRELISEYVESLGMYNSHDTGVTTETAQS
ncbi:MAG: PilZ domain-containing protein [Candidatus Omnitrophica bacterium]|nr:PilZ domain-containing protein [Candidatus Omnitrophota bacterium]MBU1127861.1 PilZ domain-containing protein [Candidatus Omnitrophota bacterium]MBU1784173.1 PilZ domain-containing protein [Candidatus Omnitrophota bacterium]MBU1851376.1 PilZ domain-containing protein [Candidatus Omnitrophota bacterium]